MPSTNIITEAEVSAKQIQLSRIQRSFTYHPPKGDQPDRYVALRNAAKDLATTIVNMTPASREQSCALTSLEESIMWANKAIAINE